MLEVVPAVPSCQVVQHERGTRKEGLADIGCVCQPGDHVWQLGVAGAVLPGSQILLGRWLMEQARAV